MALIGTIEDIVFRNDENGYTVAKLEKDGSLRESFYIGSPVISKLAVSGDKVYALDFSGRLTAFEIG